jgi:predicted DNA-binding transcriptional regulator AlpA
MKETNPTPIPATKPAPGELMTDQQTAEILAVEPRTLRLWRNTRGLPHIKITSKVIRYRRADVDAWLERRRTVIPPHRQARRAWVQE